MTSEAGQDSVLPLSQVVVGIFPEWLLPSFVMTGIIQPQVRQPVIALAGSHRSSATQISSEVSPTGEANVGVRSSHAVSESSISSFEATFCTGMYYLSKFRHFGIDGIGDSVSYRN